MFVAASIEWCKRWSVFFNVSFSYFGAYRENIGQHGTESQSSHCITDGSLFFSTALQEEKCYSSNDAHK